MSAGALKSRPRVYGEEVISEADLIALPEYSCTLPTGTTLGKRWRCATKYTDRDSTEWMIATYVEHPDPDRVGIAWVWAVVEPGRPHVGPMEPWRERKAG